MFLSKNLFEFLFVAFLLCVLDWLPWHCQAHNRDCEHPVECAFLLLRTSSFKCSDAVLRTSAWCRMEAIRPRGTWYRPGVCSGLFSVVVPWVFSVEFPTISILFREWLERVWDIKLCCWPCFEIKAVLEDKCCCTKFGRQREIRRERHEIARGSVELLFFCFLLFLALSSFSGNKGEDGREVVTSHPKHKHVVHWRELSISFLLTKCSPGTILLRKHRRGFYGRNLIHFTGEWPCVVAVCTATCTVCQWEIG
jgi:hypothetical protein